MFWPLWSCTFFNTCEKGKFASRNSPFVSNIVPPAQSCTHFLQYRWCGDNIKNVTKLANFTLCCNVRIMQHKNRVKIVISTHGSKIKPALWIHRFKFFPSIAPLMQGDTTSQLLSNYFVLKKHLFHTDLSAVKIFKCACNGKRQRVISAPVASGTPLSNPPLKRRGRDTILLSKTRWVHHIFEIFSQLCHKFLPSM